MKARVLVTGLLFSASCVHASLNRAQSRGSHQDGVKATDVPVRGFQVSIETTAGTESGELIAVDERFVYLNATESPNEWAGEQIPRAQIVRVLVEVQTSASTTAGIWTAVGCASTASHGAFLIFSGPVWLATGLPASIGESQAAHAEARPDELSKLYQFARFPQGLPPSFAGAMRPAAYEGTVDAGTAADVATRANDDG
jgi:hypothetical protein